MDISNSYQTNNGLPVRPSVGGAINYDLKSEKQEIEEMAQEIKKELLAKWKKSYANAQIFPAEIAAMHPEVVSFLLSFGLVGVYDDIARQVNLDANGRNALPHVVWQIAQTKNWGGLDQILESQIPLVHSAHLQLVGLLQQNVLNKIKIISEKPIVSKPVVDDEKVQKKIMQLQLSQALLQYPNLAEQNITSNQIKLRYAPLPMRPSIKNWITDFHDAMGSGKHSPIDRGNFLFHSENGKTLTSAERQKLGTILKSLDEQTLLTIDSVAQVVVFNVDVDVQRNDANAGLDSRFRGNDTVGHVGDGKTSPVSVALMQREEKADDFFQIPGSKPPIGTEEYDAKNNMPREMQTLVQQPSQVQQAQPRSQKNVVDLRS